MTIPKLLIFDLDNTIFETKSIGEHAVAAVMDDFRSSISPLFSHEKVEAVITDLWNYPFDHVARQYKLSEEVSKQFSASINSHEYQLEIETYPDFELMRELNIRKVLVTTGFEKLQRAKIEALQLHPVFEEIHIDQLDAPIRIHKKGIFQQILDSFHVKPSDIFVIGDNPQSELKAGRELGMVTVQVAKHGQTQSAFSDYYMAIS